MFGGIFEQVSPLGFQTSLGGLELDKCQLFQWMKTQSAAEVQKAIKNLGASSLTIDGLWGPCSESAFQKITGAPTSKASLEKIGITCSSFEKKLVSPVSDCKSGADAIESSSSIAPATVSQFQTPSTVSTAAPSLQIRPIMPIRLPLLTPQQPAPQAEAQLPPAPADIPAIDDPGAAIVPVSEEKPWGKYAMYAGVAAAAGLGLFFLLKKDKPRRAGRTYAVGGRV
jgi:hypothetical protein